MTAPLVELRGAAVRLGTRTLWSELDLALSEGEFLAVLGPNGTGKTTLLKVLLGLVPLSAGTVQVNGVAPHAGNPEVGYVPQQQAFDRTLPVRGRDLVRFGVDGHRWGLPLHNRATRRRVDAVLDAVGATEYANAPVGLLSGGEQQRLRIAQALLGRSHGPLVRRTAPRTRHGEPARRDTSHRRAPARSRVARGLRHP